MDQSQLNNIKRAYTNGIIFFLQTQRHYFNSETEKYTDDLF